MKKKAADAIKPLDRVRQICLALPEAYEKVAWSTPTFRVGKKQFAIWTDDHHGDGKTAIWCKAPDGAQEALIESNPEVFYRPAYVGHLGWVGIRLDRDLSWDVVASLLREGYLEVATKKLRLAITGGYDRGGVLEIAEHGGRPSSSSSRRRDTCRT